MSRELVQKHRVCQIAAQPALEKMIRKLEEVAQRCPEKVQKRPRDKREGLRQETISSTFGMKVAFRSITGPRIIYMEACSRSGQKLSLKPKIACSESGQTACERAVLLHLVSGQWQATDHRSVYLLRGVARIV